MTRSQYIRLILFPVLTVLLHAQTMAGEDLSDQLRQRVLQTTEPKQRIELLINLKDLHVYSKLNIPYSTQLLREAIAENDTYAMSLAANDIVQYYASYPERKDSLLHYIDTLALKTADTPENGIDAYLRLVMCINRMKSPKDNETSTATAAQVLHGCDTVTVPDNIYHRVRLLTTRAYARTALRNQPRNSTNTDPFEPMNSYRKAYEECGQMHGHLTQHLFSELIYRLLSGAYLHAGRYDDLIALSKEELERATRYLEQEERSGRRPYLYQTDDYARPYKNLIVGSALSGRKSRAQHYFDEFRHRAQHSDKNMALFDKAWLYEIGSEWQQAAGHLDTSILYSDSLVNLIENKQERFGKMLRRTVTYYRDRTALLLRSHRYGEAFEACEQTYHTQQKINDDERHERAEVIRRRHEIGQLKISEAESRIQRQFVVNAAFAIVTLLLLWCGSLLYKSYRHNRNLQQFILRHARKAEESSRMKTAFLNTIYRGINTPLHAIDEAACALIIGMPGAAENATHAETIRQNTASLLSILNNILETANINSLTEPLNVEIVDIDQICRTELHKAVYNNPNPAIDFRIDAPEEACPIHTNARYFSFVIHKLLENSTLYTQSGSITLFYRINLKTNQLTVSVTDTGCGVPPQYRDSLFEVNPETAIPTEMSLTLCALIIRHLQGEIKLDPTYTSGTRITFTIPTDL